MTDKPVSTSTPKLWTRLGSAGLTGLAAASMTLAAHAEANGEPDKPAPTYQVAQGGEGGEGGEMAAASSAQANDAEFFTLLELVEGHLRAGIELYRQGETNMAKVHMKHPSHELYVDLEPALSARKIEGFAGPLEQLAVAVESGKPVDQANVAFERVLQEIERVRAATSDDLPAKLRSITGLIRTAAEEYEIGVKGGRVTDPQEYQDAWGFTQTAKARLAGLSDSDRKRMGAGFAQMAAELDALDKAWPSLAPPDKVATEASLLYAAAARLELAAMAVK